MNAASGDSIVREAVVHPGSRRHPPSDLFERVYDATIARGSGADLDDLRARAERFRRNVDAIADACQRARWRGLADGIECAVDALEARSPERAERWLRRAVRVFALASDEARS